MMQDNKVEIFIGSTIEEGDCRADRDKVEDFYYKLNDALAPKGRGVVVYSCLTWDTQMRKGGSQSALDDMIRRSDVAVFVIAERVGEYTMGEIELALANRDGKKDASVVVFRKRSEAAESEREKIEKVERECFEHGAAFVEYDTFDEIKSRLESYVTERVESKGKKSGEQFMRDPFEGKRERSSQEEKPVRIFLSSSMKESARVSLRNRIHAANDMFEVFGVKLDPIECDYSSGEAKKVIDETIERGDICCFVFDGTEAEHIRDEFAKATGLMDKDLGDQERGARALKPRIYCFFYESKLDDVSEEMRAKIAGDYKHYYEPFVSVDTIRYRIVMSVLDLIKAELKSSSNGLILFGGAAAIDINELPEFFNNEDAKRAKQRFFDARRRFEECKFLIEHDPTEENSKNYDRAAAAYSSARAEIEALYSGIWDMGMHVIHTADGVILEEEAKARKLFREGKLEEANEVIDPDYIFKKCEEKEKKDSAEYRAFISAMVYKALLIKEQKTSTEQKIEESDKCFDKLEKMTALCRYGFEAMIGKVRYLLEFKQDENAALEKGRDVLKKAEEEYYKDCDARGKATLKVLIARAHIALGDGAAAQKEIDDAIEIFKELRETDKSVTEELAQTYVLSAQNHKDSNEPEQEAEALFNAGLLYMDELDDYINAEKHYLSALEIYERLTKENPKNIGDLATTYNNLGNLYSNLGQYDKAEKYYMCALEIKERFATENPAKYREGLALTYNNLGCLYGDLNQYDKAEKYYMCALEIKERLAENPAKYSGDLARTCNNMGVLYKELNQYGKAEEYGLRALEILECLAKENPEKYSGDLAATYNNMGVLYKELNQYGKAEKCYSGALEIYERLATENPAKYRGDLAATYSNLGVLYGKLEQYDKAEEYYLRALEIREHLAKENPAKYSGELAATYNNLGALYEDLNQYDKAEEYCLHAFEIKEHLAKENPAKYSGDLATTYNNMGNLYSNLGQYDKAGEYCLHALEIREHLAKENPAKYSGDLAMTYNNMGVLYYKLNQYGKAEKCYSGALEIYERFATENPAKYREGLAVACNNMGSLYRNLGQYDKAEEYYLRALEIREHLAKENPAKYSGELAATYNNLGALYEDLNQYDKAEEYCLHAFEIKEHLAKENPAKYSGDLATTYNNMGSLYRNLGQYDKAEEYYLRALEIRGRLAKEIPAKYSEDLAMTCNNMGILYRNLGQYDKAEEYYLRALEIRECLAKANPAKYSGELARTYNNMENLYSNLGQYDKAEEYGLRALEIYECLAKENPEKYNESLVMTIWNLGLLSLINEKIEKGCEQLCRAFEMCNKNGNKRKAAEICEFLVIAYMQSGDEENAKKFAQEAERLRKELNEKK